MALPGQALGGHGVQVDEDGDRLLVLAGLDAERGAKAGLPDAAFGGRFVDVPVQREAGTPAITAVTRCWRASSMVR
jgi:hypothetical protein